MKPIEVIRRLVLDNPHDTMLGEVVRQYIKELDKAEEKIRNNPKRIQEIFMYKKKDKYIHIKNVFVWFGILPITTFFLWYLIMKLGNVVALWLGT